MKKSLVYLLTLIFAFSSVSILGVGTASAEEQATVQVIMQSNFKADYEKGTTNWVSTLPSSNHVEIKNDGSDYFARISNAGKTHGGMFSTPFELKPYNDYEFSFYFRIPEQTRADGYNFSGTHYQPAFALFEVTANEDKTSISAQNNKAPEVNNNANNNLYAYSGNQSPRRTAFESNWTIELPDNKVEFTQNSNSIINYQSPKQYADIVKEKDATKIYTEWTKFTVKFKGIADEAGETSQMAAFAFYFLNLGNEELILILRMLNLWKQ